MKKSFLHSVSFLVLLPVFFSSCIVYKEKPQVQRTVTVTSVGQVKVPSNQANITLSVITRNKDIIFASQENTEKMTAVKKALREAGVPFSSITTSNFSIYQETDYQNGRNVPGLYNVSNQVNVVVGDVSTAGSIIDAAIKAGANQLSNLTYTVSSTNDEVKQARLLAVKQAEEKANTLVTSSGATLGRVLSITEEVSPLSYEKNAGVRNAILDSQSQSVEVTGGDYTVSVTIKATYEIQ